jgi:hypothetical protein
LLPQRRRRGAELDVVAHKLGDDEHKNTQLILSNNPEGDAESFKRDVVGHGWLVEDR